MKNYKKRIILLAVVVTIIFSLLISVLCFGIYSCYKKAYVTLHIPPDVCGLMMGSTPDDEVITPEIFCKTWGKDTWLKGKFLFAKVDDDGCLLLTLNKNIIPKWKSSFFNIQLLQCALGDSRNIVERSESDFSSNVLTEALIRNASNCGYEISEDFKTIIANEGDALLCSPVIITGCLQMQVFEGGDCSNTRVEFSYYNKEGEKTHYIVRPDIYGESFGVENE